MADRKITDLTALAAGSQATGDLVTIVDVSESAAADKNKKMTMENLFKGIPGDVGIGTSSVDRHFHVEGTDNVQGKFQNNGSLCLIEFEDTNTTAGNRPSFGSVGNEAVIHAAGSERLRVDDSGRLLVGATASTHSDAQARLQVHSAGATNIVIARNDSTISAGNTIGMLQFYGNDGGTYQQCAAIRCDADLDHANNDKPSRLVFETTADDASSGTERMRIDSGGRVAIGTTQIGSGVLTVYGAGTARAMFQGTSTGTGDSQGFTTGNNGGVNAFLWNYENGNIRLATNNTERMRIDSSGLVGIGSSSPGHELVVRGSQPFLELRSSDTGNHAGEDVFSGILFGTDDTSTTVDPHGFIKAVHTRAGSGHSSADAGLTFGTSASTTAPATERMRITSDGDVLIGQSSTDTPGFGNTTLGAAFENLGADGVALFASRSNNICAGFNRAQDGAIVQFASAGNVEGSVSISGSDCNFNGATLTRWSQLAGGAERVEILRGSVLSNLDEMCVWAHAAQDEVLWTAEDELPEGVSVGDVKTPARDAYTELNEQMNRQKVSDVEGDPNVAGVFRCWDDDDDTFTNDFYCAMTGDFIIRIAQGTTVARGDLLMSAGDGTAKPQGDDIVRSKTIAKVTSTTVSTTYADGSYCVPCVLMAC